MKQKKRRLKQLTAIRALITIAAALGFISASAEVVFDHSSVVSLPAQGQKLSGTMTIPASAGTQVGGNLFHSFQSFNIRNNESATFTASGSTAAINNVIGRVTGGSASLINGLLRSTIPDAAVYLLNPQGIVFGVNAKLDVQGSFHASTASTLSLDNDGLYSAFNNENTVLTAAPPQAFGFFDNSATPTLSVNGAKLEVTVGKTLDLTAQAIDIRHDAKLSAPAGEVRLLARHGENWLNVNKTEHLEPTASNSGDITIANSLIDASGDGGGYITVSGNKVAFINSAAYADNNGANDATGKGVVIRGYDIKLTQRAVTADAASSGHAGNVDVLASHKFSISNGAEIGSNVFTNAQGDAGNVTITAPILTIANQNNSYYTGIFSNVYSASSGNAGVVTVNAGDITITANAAAGADQSSRSLTGIFSNTYSGSSGDAGVIHVTANNVNVNANPLATTEQGHSSFIGIFSNAYEGSGGNAGIITVRASDTLVLDKHNSQAVTGIFSEAPNDNYGSAGSVTVRAELLKIFDGSFISSSTYSYGNAGNVDVSADTLLIDGNNSANLTGIVSNAYKNSGNAGSVKVRANRFDLLGNGKISSSIYAQGSAGRVIVKANKLTIDDQNNNDVYATGILSDTYQGSQGNAGMVRVMAKNLAIVNGGRIGSNGRGSGNAGSVTVDTDKLSINTQNDFDQTGIFSAATDESSGNAGDIKINISEKTVLNRGQINSSLFGSGASGGMVSLSSPQLTLRNGSEISALANSSNELAEGGSVTIEATQFNISDNSHVKANNVGKGDAGAIHVTAKDALLIKQGSGLTVESELGNAGSIYVNVGRLFYLLNSQLSTTAAAGKGNGGDILFNTPSQPPSQLLVPPSQFVVLNNSQIIAKALKGNGGNIDIFTAFFLKSVESIVDASSEFGLQGKVSINSANSNIAGSIAVLPSIFIDSSNLLQNECNQQSKQTASSFTAFSVQGAVLASPDNVFNYMPSSLIQCSAVF